MKTHRGSSLLARPRAVVLFLAALALPGAFGAHRAYSQEDLDRIVASVDGEPITMHDLKTFSAANGVALPADPKDPRGADVMRQALRALITEKMLDEELKNPDNQVEETSLDKYIARIREQNHLSEEEFRRQLLQSGTTWEDFRKRARMELQKMTMLDRAVRQKVAISADQVKAYYDSHQQEFVVTKERMKLAQILIAVDPGGAAEEVEAARKKAEDLRRRALAGEDFGTLAARYSDDESRSKDGELGYFAPDDIMDEIREALLKVQPGGLTELVRTRHGFHVVKLVAHEKPGPRPIAEVSEEVRDKLAEEASQERFKHWLDEELIKSHHVESFF